MSNRQIVLDAIERKPGASLPCDIFEGWSWPGITAKLIDTLGAADYDDMLEKLCASCRWIYATYSGPALPEGATDRVASPHTRYSLNGSIWSLRPGIKTHGSGTAGHPLSSAETAQDVLAHHWPSPDWFDYQSIPATCKRYQGQFIVLGGFSPVFYLIADLCGMEKALMNMVLNPAVMRAMVDKIEEFYTGYFQRIARAGKGVLDAIAFGDDFSSQSATLLSPELWRKYFKPTWTRLFAIAKQNGYKVFFHSCGAVAKVIPDLIDAGLDVLYPIQPAAADMDLATLRSRFGKDLSFYGGFDVQGILPFGTAAELEKEVDRLANVAGDGGGYILSTSHVIMEDVPPENIIALYAAARRIADRG